MESWTPIAKKYHPLICGSIDGTDDYPHDRAVLRALNSSYKPNKQVDGDPLCTVFVGRLNPETVEESLHKVFSEYGSIKRLRLVRDIISGFSKRYAFIEYKSGSSARKAASQADKIRLDDRELFVDMECERELEGWIPRRLGGGFSGKKESGQLRFGGKDRPFRKPIILNRDHEREDLDTKSHNRSRSRFDYKKETASQNYSQKVDRYKEYSRSHKRSYHSSDRSHERSRSPSSRKTSKHKKYKRHSRSRSRERDRSRRK